MGEEYSIAIGLAAMLAILSIICSVINAVITGVYEGFRDAKGMLGGMSPEDIRKREEEKTILKRNEEKKRMESVTYRILHPLDFLNYFVLGIIKEKIDGKHI